MANTLLPIDERNLTPDEVVALDRRRRRGQLFLVIALQMFCIASLVAFWVGQDATLSPGWAHPMLYWDIVLYVGFAIFAVAGIKLRKGSTEFISY